MNRFILQATLIILGIGFITILFIQPKFIVNNEEKLEVKTPVTPKESSPSTVIDNSHQKKGNLEEQKLIKKWTAEYYSFSSPEKKLILADSLALFYNRLFEYDSAAKYVEQLVFLAPNDTNKLRAGLGLYQSFKVSMNPSSRKEIGLKALIYIDELLATHPSWIDLKVKKAVIKVYTETPPMAGINMLKEIIAENPSHEEARMTLGEFMLTIQKVQKAILQFEAIVAVNPSNEKALLYLVECYQSVQNTAKAIQYLEKLESLNIQDAYIKSVIEKNRKELN